MSTKIYASQDWVEERLSSGASKPDWSQSDETAADYIKNRTHWESVENIVFAQDVSVSIVPEDGFMSNPFSIDIIEGQTYDVIWDGVPYSCVAYIAEGPDTPAIGNGSIANVSGGNDEPFFCTVFEGDVMLFASDTAETHTISISSTLETVKQIDLKYLPIVKKGREILLDVETTSGKINGPYGAIEEGEYIITFDGTPEKVAFTNVDIEGLTSIAKTSLYEIHFYNGSVSFRFEDEDTVHHVKIEKEIYSINEKYLPEGGFGYTESKGDFTVDTKKLGMKTLPDFPVFDIGDTVVISVDGIEYSLVAYDDEGVVGIGDSFAELDNENGTYGWKLSKQVYGSFVEINFAAIEAHTVSYSRDIVHRIDEKYLPNSVLLKDEAIPVPSIAQVGQTIVVSEVDENGKPTKWEAIDINEVVGDKIDALESYVGRFDRKVFCDTVLEYNAGENNWYSADVVNFENDKTYSNCTVEIDGDTYTNIDFNYSSEGWIAQGLPSSMFLLVENFFPCIYMGPGSKEPGFDYNIKIYKTLSNVTASTVIEYIDQSIDNTGFGDNCVTANFDSINKTGFYKGILGNVSGVPEAYANEFWHGYHIEAGVNNCAIQRANCWYYGNCTIERTRNSDGTWNEWEWVNPPMVGGVEYRTTERYLGEPVYVFLYDLGYADLTGTFAHGLPVKRSISVNLINGNEDVTHSGGINGLGFNSTDVFWDADWPMGAAKFTLKYNK
jgi:hypothetical protein